MGERGNRHYDVVVVGGGAAGLSGAMVLARARRSVLVVDAGEPRNAPAAGVHGYLGLDGTAPAELLATGREEVAAYGGTVVDGRVVAAEAVKDGGAAGGGFRVVLDDGSSVTAARLLVTTGLADELPEVAGLAEHWGRDVLHCPYCHGWEVRDEKIAVLATGPFAVHQALLWRQWSKDVTLLLHTADEPTDEEYEQLAARDIAVVDGVVDAVTTDSGDRLAGVRLADGRILPCRALVIAPRFTARAGFLAGLGLTGTEVERSGHVVGSAVAADPTGATEVPGVWVAGNITNLFAQVGAAAAAGVTAAAAINADLVNADIHRAVTERRTPFSAQREREAAERTMTPHRHGILDTHTTHTAHSVVQEDTPVQKTDDDSSAAHARHWDDRYREQNRIWSGKPNPTLVAETAGLTPGTALDLGCGEGGDAIWLARQGWRVTGTDISTVALGRTAEHAAEAGVTGLVTLERHNFAESFPAGAFDLVSAHFLHSEYDMPREEILRRAAGAVAPGGVLLIVGHYTLPDWADHLHHISFPSGQEVLDSLELPDGEWEVLADTEHEREATSPDGRTGTRSDCVLKVRRR
ncbi:methyltransferase domain-containing protein [Streptomyces paludis]|uniref:Methyltransferase domain-containing protein n=2 Tax=Streptomyces paludis TaxID=2282738 RepID=A0A345HUM1_9ACTN|nr:methyltransferase domain-containing protein [Streptomyces paludis]